MGTAKYPPHPQRDAMKENYLASHPDEFIGYEKHPYKIFCLCKDLKIINLIQEKKDPKFT